MRSIPLPPSDPFTIALTGDVMLGRLVDEAIARHGFAYPWGDMLSLLHAADLVCINLECTLTSTTERWRGDPDKPFFFRADPSVVETLRIGRVSFASLANNHILDFGVTGLLETIAVLDGAGISHAGTGADIDGARAPALLAAHGWRVAVLAFADYPEAWCASPHAPGICFTPISLDARDFGVAEQAIARARAAADFVIFSIHWGPNMRIRPPRIFRTFAHRVIAAGADIFWGHSAHLLQGIELVDGKPIFYDTGDFIDDYAVHPHLRNDFSALFLIRVGPRGIERIKVVPALIDRMHVTRAPGRTRALIARRLTTLCSELGTSLVDEGDGLTVDGLNASVTTRV